MKNASRPLGERGFTLMELLIVTAIIGIVAYVSILQYVGLIEKTAEGATKGGLGTLRTAASIYYGNHDGNWPTTLDDTPSAEFSRYVTHLPLVQATGRFDPNTHMRPRGRIVKAAGFREVPRGQNVGWLYDSSTGNIYVNSTLRDSKSVPYSFFGFE